jgi:hypothetical protein
MKFSIFAGDLYWVYDGSEPPKVSSSYRKTTKHWGRVKGPLDDVLYVRRGYIYFFTSQTYNRYNCAKSLVRGNITCCAVRKLKKQFGEMPPKYGKVMACSTVVILGVLL